MTMLRLAERIVVAVAILSWSIHGQRYHLSYRANCPKLYAKVFKGYVPRGNMTSGNFTEVENAESINECVMECCRRKQCNVVLQNDLKCYHVTCASNELCMPIVSPRADADKHVSLVLVKPVSPGDETWADVLSENYRNDQNEEELLNRLLGSVDGRRVFNEDEPDVAGIVETAYDEAGGIVECEVGVAVTCGGANEECVQVVAKSRSGVCRCREGYVRSGGGGACVENGPPASSSVATVTTATATANGGGEQKQQLTVSVRSKEVRLPENEVTLAAYVVPVVQEGGPKYQYEWKLLQQPPGSNTVRDQNEALLHLSKLSEGLYTFKVTVSNGEAIGVTYANVSVLAPKRINRPPQVVVKPPAQTVKLPNTGAVLDASETKDDDKGAGLTYHWELQQGPLGYQPRLTDTPILQLNNLAIPGNYTFRVVVTDSDHASNSSTANITVLKIADYPPEANAGRDLIIYLPHNNATLNGNLSTDDRAIAAWEWTKSPADADKAADMQDTRTPYLKLSNLEAGMYTFTLKVTDSANQSSSSDTHVFVMPPTNRPPVADAGANATISLPQTWTLLDGSRSRDDDAIVSFSWEQLSGPSSAQLRPSNESRANATGLTKGDYSFKLTVTDNSGNVASSTVRVSVTQSRNEKPKADAGGDVDVALPANAIFVNGSRSSDDLAIVRWQWQRDDASLAAGAVVPGSDAAPVLMLTDLLPGRYVFRLTVWDEQGLSDTDSVSLMVRPDPLLLQLVELTVEVDSRRLTQLQFSSLQAKLALLVSDGARLRLRELRPEPGTDRAVIVFYVETSEGKPVPATEVVERLRSKIALDDSLLGLSVTELRTRVCQNRCSQHGVCNEQTRRCLCEAFWMQDLFRFYLGDGQADCAWSVLYVVVGLLCSAVALSGLCWALACACSHLCTTKRCCSRASSSSGRPKQQTYSLLGDSDDAHSTSRFVADKAAHSDSEDTDSDVLFESSRNKSSRNNRGNHNVDHGDLLRQAVTKANQRNGFIKLGRRVKT